MRLLFATILLLLPLTAQSANIVDLSQISLVNTAETAAETSAAPIDLGMEIFRGVEAHAYLEPRLNLEEGGAADDNRQKFILMVEFADRDSAEVLIRGQVAARIFGPENQPLKTIRLEPEEGKWTGSLDMSLVGETMIKIGSKFKDGKKRIYRFFHNSAKELPIEEADNKGRSEELGEQPLQQGPARQPR